MAEQETSILRASSLQWYMHIPRTAQTQAKINWANSRITILWFLRASQGSSITLSVQESHQSHCGRNKLTEQKLHFFPEHATFTKMADMILGTQGRNMRLILHQGLFLQVTEGRILILIS